MARLAHFFVPMWLIPRDGGSNSATPAAFQSPALTYQDRTHSSLFIEAIQNEIIEHHPVFHYRAISFPG
jgi:hypothetical protein